MSVNEVIKHSVASFCVDVLHGPNKPSFAWKYFGKLVLNLDGKRKHVLTDKVFCKKCLERSQIQQNRSEDSDDPDSPSASRINDSLASCLLQIKSYSKSISTGNLATHLKNEHGIADDKNKAKQGANIALLFDARSRSRATPASAGSLPTEKTRRWYLARDYALWCCRALIPFSTVEDESTTDFMRKYNVVAQNENMPSRSAVSRQALDDVYESMFDHVKNTVESASDFGCITLDGWSDRYKRNSYFTFTYHAITEDFELERYLLQTSVCFEKKTALQICGEVESVLARFSLEEKEIWYVTDAGRNMVAGIRNLGAPSHLCIGHGIHNLVATDGVKNTPTLQSACSKAKVVVKTVKYRAPDLEREAQKEQHATWLENILEVGSYVEADDEAPIESDAETDSTDSLLFTPTTPTTVKLDVITRWHTLLIMINSIEQNKGPITKVLNAMGKGDLQITPTEMNFLNALAKFLEAFRRSVEILSAEKSCTINLALLLRSELEEILQESDDDPIAIMDMKRRMRLKLNHRFPVTELTVTAALLDPRCFNLKNVNDFIQNQNCTKEEFLASKIRKNIRDRHLKLHRGKSAKSLPDQNPSSKETAKNLELMKLSKKHSIKDSSNAVAVDKECNVYLSANSSDTVEGGNILKFWKDRRHQFPWLATAARKFLCVQATSTPSEQVFSVAGEVITAKRNRLDPARADKIIFIHDNYDVCKAHL